MRKIGVFGGTFDPIHLGHLAVARDAADQLGLEVVHFVPAARPPHKPDDDVSPAEHRVRMVALAIEGEPRFELCTLELEREGPSYTVDTLEEFTRRYGSDADLYYIVGGDTPKELHHWRRPERLLDLARLVVVARPGFASDDSRLIAPDLGHPPDRVIVLEGSSRDIASSNLRERARQGRSLLGLAPTAVAKYIDEQGLYGGRPARSKR